MKLQDYQEKLKGADCKWCRRKNYETKEVTKVLLENEPIEHYEHSGGYEVEGFAKKLWLYVTCPRCQYQWSLEKITNV